MNVLYTKDTGYSWTSFASGLTVTFLPVLIWLYWLTNWAPGLHDVVALDHALVAREIVEGRGMSSAVSTPLHLRLEQCLEKADPIFARPALSLWEALWFSMVDEPEEFFVLFAAGVFFIPTSWLVFLLAARFHSRTTAWICLLIFVLNPSVLNACTSGRPEGLAMFLLCLLFFIVSNEFQFAHSMRPSYTASLWGGVAAGILIQCVPYIVFPVIILLPLVWVNWCRRKQGPDAYSGTNVGRLPYLSTAVLYVAGVVLPGVLVFGGRLFVAGNAPVPVDQYLITVNSSVALGWSFWREYSAVSPDLFAFVAQFTPSVMLKWFAGLSYGFNGLFDVLPPVVTSLFFLALFFPEYGESHGYRWLLLVSIMLHIAVMALFYWDAEMLIIWTPMIIVTGIGALSDFLHDRYANLQAVRLDNVPHSFGWGRRFQLYYLPLSLLMIFTGGTFFLRTMEMVPPKSPEITKAMERLKENPDRYGSIITPAPWLVSWHTGCRTLWMPETEYQMSMIDRSYGTELQSVYLSRNRAEILHDSLPVWWYLALRQRDRLPSYQLAEFSAYGEAVYTRIPAEGVTAKP